MKKRVKLLTTIASLCLAVALMAFGVYAASSATTAITSQVSFSVVDVFVDVTGDVKLAGELVAGSEYADESYEVDGSGIKVAKDAGKTDAAAVLDAWAIPDVEFTATKTVLVYTLTVENASTEDKVNVVLSALLKDIEATQETATYTTDGNAEDKTDAAYNAGDTIVLDAEASVTFTLTRTLSNPALKIEGVAANSWDAVLTCTKVASN